MRSARCTNQPVYITACQTLSAHLGVCLILVRIAWPLAVGLSGPRYGVGRTPGHRGEARALVRVARGATGHSPYWTAVPWVVGRGGRRDCGCCATQRTIIRIEAGWQPHPWQGSRGGRRGRRRNGETPILRVAGAVRSSPVLFVVVDGSGVALSLTLVGRRPVWVRHCRSTDILISAIATVVPRRTVARVTAHGGRPRIPRHSAIHWTSHVVRWDTKHPGAATISRTAPAKTWRSLWVPPALAETASIAIATVLPARAVFGPVARFPADVTPSVVSHSGHGTQPTGGQLYVHQLAFWEGKEDRHFQDTFSLFLHNHSNFMSVKRPWEWQVYLNELKLREKVDKEHYRLDL